MKRKGALTALVFWIYFCLGLVTLNDYGISWDEPAHFKRGQAYLHYYLTRESSYEDVIQYDLKKARSDKNYHDRSIYKNDTFDPGYFFENDSAHPPLNGILAALTNKIFYEKLGWVGDVAGYHIFEILISSVLVAVVFCWAFEVGGIWTGVLAAIFMGAYPLFWAESHFNIKDPVETAFVFLSLYFFWRGVVKTSSKNIIFSSIFAGMALGTKFNIVFLPLMIVPWMGFLLVKNRKLFLSFMVSKRIILALCFFPLIVYFIFVISWPYIWEDIYQNTIEALIYYKSIGVENSFQIDSISGKWNPYAVRWIIYTTPPLMIFFFLIGLVGLTKEKKGVAGAHFLWLSVFLVTLVRVSIPGMTIYGGVRQIMEYIPAMALIAALGAERVRRLVGVNYFFLAAILLVLVWTNYKLHPYENIYFNDLGGGLKSAVESGFPSAANSFGTAYLEGIEWVNENLEEGANLALVQGTTENVPSYWIAPKINYSNYYWSGILKEGEYLMELTYNYEFKSYYYVWEYVEKMLDPVYQVKIREVPLLTIWKNDMDHTKEEYRRSEINYEGSVEISWVNDNTLGIAFEEPVELTRLKTIHGKGGKCKVPINVVVRTSLNGEEWLVEGDGDPRFQLPKAADDDPLSLQYYFAARKAKLVEIRSGEWSGCMNDRVVAEVVVLE
jgi:hypothetical protein